MFRQVSLSKRYFLVDNDGDVIIHNHVFPYILLSLMYLDIVYAFLVYLLALEHLLQDAVLIADQVEGRGKIV